MFWERRVGACLFIVSIAACQPDADSVVGPAEIQVVPDRSRSFYDNGGAELIAYSHLEGETAVDSFGFDGAYSYEVDGSPWGIWLGDNDTYVTDPPTGLALEPI